MIMRNASKIIKKMNENPRDWRIEQLETVAKHYGINVRKGKGSHVVFNHPAWIELLCVPAHRPVKPVYIKKFVALINLLEIPCHERA